MSSFFYLPHNDHRRSRERIVYRLEQPIPAIHYSLPLMAKHLDHFDGPIRFDCSQRKKTGSLMLSPNHLIVMDERGTFVRKRLLVFERNESLPWSCSAPGGSIVKLDLPSGSIFCITVATTGTFTCTDLLPSLSIGLKVIFPAIRKSSAVAAVSICKNQYVIVERFSFWSMIRY